MVESAAQLDPAWLSGKRRVGLTAGASVPENLVREIITRLREMGVRQVTQLAGAKENVTFPLPRALSQKT